MPHVLPVDEEDPVELLKSSVHAGRATLLDVDNVDADLGAVSRESDAQLFASDPL